MSRRLQGRPAVLIGALVLDLLAGDPPNRFHPVAWFGKAANLWKKRAPQSPRGRLAFGTVSAASLPLLYAGAAWLVYRAAGTGRRLPVEVALLKSTFAVRGLLAAGGTVGSALATDDLNGARQALGALVSRDVEGFDRRLIASAAVESLAENVVDSFLAPWMFYAVAGLPGAFAYRALNTLDAMWGYHNQEYEYLGKAAARLDDAANYLPATAGARLMLLAGRLLGMRQEDGGRVLSRDGGKTESPNAGRPMSAVAGLLGVQLEKPGAYLLGDAAVPADEQRIKEAQRLVLLTAVLGAGCAAALSAGLGREPA